MSFRKIFRQQAGGKGLFYSSIFIAIVAFYSLLCLSEQEIVRFLQAFESDALQKLLHTVIPVLYALSLFFVFALILFAIRYLLGRRKQEFGLLLSLGISPFRLFMTLLCESLRDGLLTLLIGLPAAIFLCESLSLLSSYALGLHLSQYHSSFSLKALLITAMAALLLQLLAAVIVSLRLCLQEPQTLLYPERREEQTLLNAPRSLSIFSLGALFLAAAYTLGINHSMLCVLCGVLGTFLLFKGLGALLATRLQKGRISGRGLSVFNLRQIQELLLSRWKLLSLISLLLAMSLSALAFGIGVIVEQQSIDARVVDASLQGEEAVIKPFLDSPAMHDELKSSYPLFIGHGKSTQDLRPLLKVLSENPETRALAEMLAACETAYFIPYSCMAKVYAARGESLPPLADRQVYFYSGFLPQDAASLLPLLETLSPAERSLHLGDKELELMPRLLDGKVVADRMINLYLVWVLPDALYAEESGDDEPFCWNLHLKDERIEKEGLIPTLMHLDQKLKGQSFSYESYLSGVGRKLFYTVSTSYLCGYIGILFLLVGNGLLVLQLLIQQEESRERYRRLLRLGASRQDLAQSTRRQTAHAFALILGVVLLNSFFACLSLFQGYTPLSQENRRLALLLSCILALLFILCEFIYIVTVRKGAEKRLLALREEGGREGSL